MAGLAEFAARRYREAAWAGTGLSTPPFASLALGAAGSTYFLMRHARFSGDRESLDAARWWIAQAEHGRDLTGAYETASSPLGGLLARVLEARAATRAPCPA